MKLTRDSIAERYRGITPAVITRPGYSGGTASVPLVRIGSRAGI